MQSTSFSGLAISDQERLEIIRAVGYDTSNPCGIHKWYKCPNGMIVLKIFLILIFIGHIYGIGDCGQAMVKSRCPECKAEIGGESHMLLATNKEDSEMTRGFRQPTFNPWQAIW